MTTKDSAYWAHLYQRAEEAQSRKEAVAILRQLQRHNDQQRNTTPIF
jgi:hypothetical protein